MGGGDLNLKKSWHPSTLRNIERVWKAEQKHEVEKQKIEQLQKELAEERAREEIQTYAEEQGVVRKKEERLDWMYQGPAAMVNREEYLLGRKVDKTLELLEQQESGTEPKKDDFDVGRSMFSSQDLSGSVTVDLANKIREDPLFNIMKQEKEQKKNLLCNPVKMKKLRQMIQESLCEEPKKKSKKSKKHSDHHSKKHHKKSKDRHFRSRSSDDERTSIKDRTSAKSSYSEYERKSSSLNNHHVEDYRYSSGSRDKKRYGHHVSPDVHSSQKVHKRNRSPVHKGKDTKERKLDAKEREERLREMMQNAKWREEQRERNVRRHREEEEREEKEHNNKGKASDFIKPLLSSAAGKGSLENRVKQKIFSIQRSSRDMDRNFARR